MLHSRLAAMTHGISPNAISNAFHDWLAHLATSPGKQLALLEGGRDKFVDWINYIQSSSMGEKAAGAKPLPQDKRFQHPDWQTIPFNWISQGFLLQEQWWRESAIGIRGVSAHHEHMVEFLVRQWLDMWSPSNSIMINPEVLRLTATSGGINLVEGFASWWRDATHLMTGRPPAGTEQFRPGQTVAVTPGKIVFRNNLIELIQYAPQTTTVFPEPLLIVPSWIMKYYILDLSPQNSLVKYLVDAGFTVFMISWKNPGSQDRACSMDDYLKLGPLAALAKVCSIFPERKVHALGYCLGGTLLAVAAATLAREEDEQIKSITLLASSLDFTEPGELGLFIDESQISFLEDTMLEKGYLDGQQMAGAFSLINSKDLVWSKLVFEYLKGQKSPVTDLRAWNADATRMPYRMHSEYLRSLYLENELAEGSYVVDGRPIALKDITVPMFVVSTEGDHVSPWKSVYKVHLLADSKITFVLTTGGHNVGIVNPPGAGAKLVGVGQRDKGYRMSVKLHGAEYESPDVWYASNEKVSGSWWPALYMWLASHSGHRVKASTAQKFLAGEGQAPELAPGSYIYLR